MLNVVFRMVLKKYHLQMVTFYYFSKKMKMQCKTRLDFPEEKYSEGEYVFCNTVIITEL